MHHLRRAVSAVGAVAVLAPAMAIAIAFAAPLAAQPDLSQVEVTATDLGGGIHMLQGAGGNLGVSVGPDGVFLIDDQYAPLTDKIVAAIDKIAPGEEIRFVLNTHWHGDHTGGNENLGERGALIVAHDNVRERMSVEQVIEAFGQTVPASPKAALPVVTFPDALTFHLNGETIRAHHVDPAHTDGDSFVYFEEADVLHTGDLFFNGLYPFIDVSSGGAIDGMIAATERMLEVAGAETKIIPGHGPLADRDDLVAFRDMLDGVRGAVAALVDEGKSLEEIQTADPLAPWNESWGGGFLNPQAFTGILFQSLSADR